MADPGAILKVSSIVVMLSEESLPFSSAISRTAFLSARRFPGSCKSLSGEKLKPGSLKHMTLKQMARDEKKRKEDRRKEALDTVRKRINYYTKIKNCSEPMSDAWADAVKKLEVEYYKETAILDGDFKP